MSKVNLGHVAESVIKYAKEEGVLFWGAQTEESYKDIAEDGILIKEKNGFIAEDLNGFFYPSLKDMFELNYKWFVENREEFGLFYALKQLDFSRPWSRWVWVVDSIDTVVYDIADEKFDRKRHRGEDYEKILLTITKDDVTKFLGENYQQLTPAIWVSSSDPTVMIYDKEKKPYGLKGGWSKDQMGEILEEWFKAVTDQKIQNFFVEDSDW